MNTDLKKCPICNTEPDITMYTDHNENVFVTAVYCPICALENKKIIVEEKHPTSCSVKLSSLKKVHQEIILKWNDFVKEKIKEKGLSNGQKG